MTVLLMSRDKQPGSEV